MLIDGPITTQTIDSSGEILDLKGLDISDFLDGKATANFEHNNDNADDVLGWFIYAKKIFGEQDCENERQKMFWEKVKTPFLYGVLELLDDTNHPGAIAVAAMLRYFKKKNEPVRSGMSIEGSTLERDGHILKRTVGRKVAITLRPCNKQCMLDVLPPERSDELFKKMESDHIQSFEIDSPILEKSEYLDKVTIATSIKIDHKSPSHFDHLPDGIYDDGKKWLVHKKDNKIIGAIKFTEHNANRNKGKDESNLTEDNTSRIDYIWTHPDYRKQNIASNLLRTAIKTHGAVESNLTATPQGQKVWESLKQDPEISIHLKIFCENRHLFCSKLLIETFL